MGGDGALAPKVATLLNLDKGGRLWVTRSGEQGPGSKQFFIEPSGSRILLASGEQGLERKFLRIRAYHTGVPNAVPVFLGDSNVTPESGFALYPLDEIVLCIGPDAQVYATASYDVGQAAPEVNVLELG